MIVKLISYCFISLLCFGRKDAKVEGASRTELSLFSIWSLWILRNYDYYYCHIVIHAKCRYLPSFHHLTDFENRSLYLMRSVVLLFLCFVLVWNPHQASGQIGPYWSWCYGGGYLDAGGNTKGARIWFYSDVIEVTNKSLIFSTFPIPR